MPRLLAAVLPADGMVVVTGPEQHAATVGRLIEDEAICTDADVESLRFILALAGRADELERELAVVREQYAGSNGRWEARWLAEQDAKEAAEARADELERAATAWENEWVQRGHRVDELQRERDEALRGLQPALAEAMSMRYLAEAEAEQARREAKDLQEQLDQLRAALRKYGNHISWCGYPGTCTCGYSAALAGVQAEGYRERPLTEDFYLDPNGEWVYRWSDERRALAGVQADNKDST